MSLLKVQIPILIAVLISITSLGLSIYSATTFVQVPSIQAPSPTPSMQVSLGTWFNWTLAEIIETEGNIYAYLGYEVPWKYGTGYHTKTLRLAKWQNGWIEVTYDLESLGLVFPVRVTLSPYKLEIEDIDSNYLTVRFLET